MRAILPKGSIHHRAAGGKGGVRRSPCASSQAVAVRRDRSENYSKEGLRTSPLWSGGLQARRAVYARRAQRIDPYVVTGTAAVGAVPQHLWSARFGALTLRLPVGRDQFRQVIGVNDCRHPGRGEEAARLV